MRLGTSLLIGAGGTTSMSLEDIRDAGIAEIEFAWRADDFDLLDPVNELVCERLIVRAKAFGMSVWSMHLPYGTEWDVSQLDQDGRDAAVGRHLRLLRLAGRWGVRTAVLHPSWEPVPPEERADRREACKASLSVLAAEAEALGIRIAVENLPRTCLGNTSAEMLSLLEADERLGVCCDVNHALQESPQAFIRELGRRIVSVHLSDNDGTGERHWLPGKGTIHWSGVIEALAAAEYEGPFLFEARPVSPRDVAESWRRLSANFKGEQEEEKEPCEQVAVTDQASDRILVLNAAAPDWDGDDAVIWSWSAHGRSDFDVLASGWGLPTDAKIRRIPAWDGVWMVVTDSFGMAAIVPYPEGGPRKWGVRVRGNLHSIELLPNGNAAIAASTEGWVRVYASSQGLDAVAYSEISLKGAHGLQWDPERRRLWALGDEELVAVQVSGPPDAPVVQADTSVRLPTPYGHDLQPVYGNRDRMWVSTGSDVYQFVKSTGAFDANYPGSESIRRAHVKSVGSIPNGPVVSTIPDGKVRGNTGVSSNDWSTDTVDFLPQDVARVLDGSAIYKARVWKTSYL